MHALCTTPGHPTAHHHQPACKCPRTMPACRLRASFAHHRSRLLAMQPPWTISVQRRNARPSTLAHSSSRIRSLLLLYSPLCQRYTASSSHRCTRSTLPTGAHLGLPCCPLAGPSPSPCAAYPCTPCTDPKWTNALQCQTPMNNAQPSHDNACPGRTRARYAPGRAAAWRHGTSSSSQPPGSACAPPSCACICVCACACSAAISCAWLAATHSTSCPRSRSRPAASAASTARASTAAMPPSGAPPPPPGAASLPATTPPASAPSSALPAAPAAAPAPAPGALLVARVACPHSAFSASLSCLRPPR
mmetsp:Transcript_4079/g.10197  ORF Transcript_4079/g.10197 Transcript_4079/m.10197 type:complete len:305 (-) Transcript_4079:800-1714(-)